MRTSAKRITSRRNHAPACRLSGIDPQPMPKTSYWYKYYTYLPKEEGVDDGNLVQVGGKQYEANPFGLYCMHGNVAEWTRSDYLPYPYNEKIERGLRV